MRLAIITDIHEDVVHLQKALDQIFKLDVDRIACLGDVVGFEPNHYKYNETRSASKCLHLLRKHADVIVSGNHDLNVTERLPYFWNEIGFPEDWYDISMAERENKYHQRFFIYKTEAATDLNQDEKDELRECSYFEVFETKKINISFSHFLYPDINGSLTVFSNKKKDFQRHFDWMQELGANISFVGHAHIQGIGIATKRGLKVSKFGKYMLKDEPQAILCPNIAKGKYKNGFVIFDTDSMTIEVFGL